MTSAGEAVAGASEAVTRPGPWQRTPAWWREAVMYQVYPRSFCDSDGDGIGDLPGITARLDHLRGAPGALGVDAIWLSPFYPSPLADYGYDISDYTAVDPTYGDFGDFDALLRAAHGRGIAVLCDLVLNHTSTQHPWFRASASSRDDPKRDWYVWRDGVDGGPPNNWLSAFRRVGRAWSLDPRTRQFYLHTFTPGQADLNWHNPEVWAAMAEVVRFWLDRGVDGFRVDVCHRIVKDAALRDNPPELAGEHRHVSHPTLRQYNADVDDVHRVLRFLRGILDGYGEVTSIGEVPIADPLRLLRYYGAGDELHMVFNFALWDAPWQAAAFRDAVDGFERHAPAWAWPCNALSNHDISRVASRHGAGGLGQVRARVAALLLLTLRGTPMLYYGEELGLTDTDLAGVARARDVDGRDPVRTPMPWDASGRGFSAGVPWLPAGADAAHRNVERQHADPASMLSLYRALVRERRRSPALRRGAYLPLDVDGDVYCYARVTGGAARLVAANFGDAPARVGHAELPAHGRLLLSTDPTRRPGDTSLRPLRLAANEGVLVALDGGGLAAAGAGDAEVRRSAPGAS